MAKKDLLSARDKLREYFASTQPAIWTHTQVANAMADLKSTKVISKKTTLTTFMKFLADHLGIARVVLKFPSRPISRFVTNDVSAYDLAISLNTNSYFSHYSAVHIHQLTDQIPRTIFTNVEQSPKPQSVEPLTQERIDHAFRRPMRKTKQLATYKGYQICMLNGKATNRLGVENRTDSKNHVIPITDLERTLIDIALRPEYAGGVTEVLTAYSRSKPTVSVKKLLRYLEKLDYKYPYHQCIGFYLDRAGALMPEERKILSQLPMQFDFYLSYNMRATEYSKPWRLFYPKGL